MPLNEYKFDRSRLAIIKRTQKHRKALVIWVEKDMMEGFEESTLWDISIPDVTQLGVETLVMIAGMALAGNHQPK